RTAQEDLRQWLAQDPVGIDRAIARNQLGAVPDAEYEPDIRLSSSRRDGRKLSQSLEAAGVVEDDPDGDHTRLGESNQVQQHRVEPQADERTGALAHFGADGKEEPALTFQRPRRGAPAPGTFVFPRQRLQGFCDALKECLYRRSSAISEQLGERRLRDAAFDLLDVAHPRS